ncbi:MAG: MFS transporter, partial [Actinomycetota bacterium]
MTPTSQAATPRLAIVGAAIWALFGGLTGLAGAVWVLVVARTGAGAGRAVVSPTHNSLLSDYYPPEVRPDVFGFHRIANGVGAFLGPLLGGLLAYIFDWRVPFLVFVIPTLVIVAIGRKMREPGRGRFERAASGAAAEVIDTDEAPPSFSESVRILMQVRTLRRIWIALPFTFGPILGFGFLLSFYYSDVFGMNQLQRGIIAAATEPMQIVAIIIGIPLASRMMLKDPGLGLRLLSLFAVGIAVSLVGFVVAPNIWFAVLANVFASAIGALLMPGILASLSLVMPPKVRSLGFALGSVFAIPGMVFLAIAASIAEAFSLRVGMLVMVPIFLVGAWILSSASLYVRQDITRVWTSTAAQAEVRLKREQGEVKLLLVRGLDVHYDGVQVLFGVDLEIDEGEIVALLGTNGAGKSTLLKAVSGLVEATNGAIVFDGRDMTYAPPDEVAGRGVVLFPGGQGVFPTLTVAEHLRLASWLHRRDKEAVAADREHVLGLFPILRDRLDEPAGNLSGGQQQMLALGMAFIERPRLLMIDELSLGLAPAVVEQLLPIVRDLAANGTTIILVEQSVNLALTIARTAYFREKGEIRFNGPTAELLERPDVLRSVFLEGAAAGPGPGTPEVGPDGAVTVPTVPATPAAVPAVAPAADVTELADRPVRLGLVEVSKRFRGIAALTDVSLEARAGEILGFIGPNGA